MNQDKIAQFIDAYLEGLKGFGVSEESIQLMLEHIRIIPVHTKEVLIRPGEICKNVYVVIEGGFVCRYIHEQSGLAYTINFYLPDLHPIMSCLDSFFNQEPTNCELKAVTHSTVVALPKSMVDLLKASDNQYAEFYHNVVITALFEENDLKTKLIAFSSKEKYEFLLKEFPSVIRSVPSKYIAEFCGISPEWLSKLKKQN